MMASDETPAGAATKIGIEVARRIHSHAAAYLAALLDMEDDLSVRVQLWVPPPPDPLTVSNWWAYREPCDCPDASFGRNPHRWDCYQTPIYAQLMRDIDTWRVP